jgi:hypothetical protein
MPADYRTTEEGITALKIVRIGADRSTVYTIEEVQ